jgi:hypothetical protein
MMRTLFAAAVALGAITGVAQAMPLAPLGASANGDVIAVTGGCGPGWPTAAACETTPTPPRTPARAASISGPVAAAAAMAGRG